MREGTASRKFWQRTSQAAIKL